MKTNLNSYKKQKLKRKSEEEAEEKNNYGGGGEVDEELVKSWNRYAEDARNSENFEIGDHTYPGSGIRGGRMQMLAGGTWVAKMFDSSRPRPGTPGLYLDRLLCFSRLAMAFYNIKEGTYFRVVKVLKTTAHGFGKSDHYITFEAFSSESTRNMGGSVTFQTKILVYTHHPRGKFQILFVRIKPDPNKSKKSQHSEFGLKAQVTGDRLSKVIKAYTIDSRLDSRYSLALYLSQYALVSHNHRVLSLSVAKHDIESLKVLKLVKPVAKVPTYLITFQAPLRGETEGKIVETFETEICMPTIFPTTTIELESEARVVTA